MFSNLAAKAALKKVGFPNDTFDFSWSKSGPAEDRPTKKLTKSQSTAASSSAVSPTRTWPDWMSAKSLPLTVQPWLTPRPPPVPVADLPRLGELAPVDRDGKLVLGKGKKVLVVFLRCVGCAFAQKTFLALRPLASRCSPQLTCTAVSHSSAAATREWIAMLGGTRGGVVQVVIDEERALYAAWGLGLGGVWYVLNPASQVAGFREKGWPGERVAGSLVQQGQGRGGGGDAVVGKGENGPVSTLGNKWQQAGAWAVDARGRIVWGGRVARVDDVMDLDAGVRALGVRVVRVVRSSVPRGSRGVVCWACEWV